MVSHQTDQPILVSVDELASQKLKEIEGDLKNGSTTNQKVAAWLSILKQIITAADLHRTNTNEKASGKTETGESIYADYSDDNEQFTTQVDLSEQFATNSVKWTIRVRAFKLTHSLVQLVIAANHDDGTKSPAKGLVPHLPDLVRLAFVAATSPYDELKMQGFEMFRVLIERFASQEDSEFPGHSILEQYKTQFLSAVKPAFNLDAPPYITAVASQICSLWICYGLEKNLVDIRRTYKLMVSSLEKLRGQGVNQHSKLYTESELEQERVDILGAWAQLYISSKEGDQQDQLGRLSRLSAKECNDLKTLVEPQTESLVESWWEAMKDYALLIMPAPKVIGTCHDNENVYTREVALRLFSSTWPKIVLALTMWLCSERDQATDNKAASDLKYFKFLTGILLKELCRCLLDKTNHYKALPQSTVLSLRSMNLLLMDRRMQSVFLDIPAMAREFHGTLYHLTVLHARDPNRALLRTTLDRLFQLTLSKVSHDDKNVHYGLAKLISLLMSAMKNIEVASNEESTLDLESNKVQLSIQLKSFVALVKSSPASSMKEVSLQVAIISVFQELLRFEQEPTVSVLAADQLNHILCSLKDVDVKKRIIEELHPELCTRVSNLMKTLFDSAQNSNTDGTRLSQVDSFLKAMRLMLSHLDQGCCKSEMESYVVSALSNLEGVGDTCDKKRRELIDFAINHCQALQATHPDDELTPKSKQVLDAAVGLQRRIKSKIDSSQRQQSVSKPKSSKPQAAKIVLKADFSNFYSNKS